MRLETLTPLSLTNKGRGYKLRPLHTNASDGTAGAVIRQYRRRGTRKTKGRDCSRPSCRLRIRPTPSLSARPHRLPPHRQNRPRRNSMLPQPHPLHCATQNFHTLTNQILPPPVLRILGVNTSVAFWSSLTNPVPSLLSPPGQGERIEEGSHLLCRVLIPSANHSCLRARFSAPC